MLPVIACAAQIDDSTAGSELLVGPGEATLTKPMSDDAIHPEGHEDG